MNNETARSSCVPTPAHMCRQEGTISELKTKVNVMDANTSKLSDKMDDILAALHQSNSDTKVKDAELYSSFKNIEGMLKSEIKSRQLMAEGQQEIHKNINSMSTRVNNIEHDVSNIKTDLGDTKRVIKENNEVLTKRVSSLEKVFGYVYAFGAVVVAVTLIIIYGHQLMQIIYPKSVKAEDRVVQQK
jgi:chromosome segregation ATPase